MLISPSYSPASYLKAESSEQPSTRNVTRVPTIGNIKSLKDLLPLFHEMEQCHLKKNNQEVVVIQAMEKLLELDFLEPIPP